MSKAFTREDAEPPEDLDAEEENPIPPGSRNYMTPDGARRLRDELRWLVNAERPEITGIVSWAAKNGDRSENGDYLYGKKRLREIDKRIRYLTRRLENTEVVDPATREDTDQVFFGATVEYTVNGGPSQVVTIVGIDETDLTRGRISWVSPVARSVIKAREGDTVTLHTPEGNKELEILEVRYEAVPIDAFQPVRSTWSPNVK
ncbi:transcription elongation factor GreB [Usitatibacter palustris]|uniref:Transcription elongation factor GreB n=1 Tax=Usitatibacter palustris TaxID=2732487 RepID=A0A6M4H8G1_9PROT|nr:transcription elongation factor GreB [Usitatibacter palustris]QJR15999.1 Transcription elongation factor GreB [Usitatibacter palustris]